MTEKANRTVEELLTVGTRFCIGAKMPTRLYGKGILSISSLTIDHLIGEMAYYNLMAQGTIVAYELVPVELDDKCGIRRLT